ncbi:PAS domain-containing protein [Vibrio sp. RE86]|uniref:CHASE4 domain-containing protein n=1 Tax=Vibrio sp. RE86 TaxID=2607605 RepID=UPI0014932AA1|nr:CHASE4 domain-containing protein [Vibrio sp. RE86]NOH79953.1 PAS domain-containing protein [Vibrio sp. RE86]
MSSRYSIDSAIKWVLALAAIVIAIVTGMAAHMALKEERQYWQSQLISNYRYSITAMVNQEFEHLQQLSNTVVESSATYGFVKFGRSKYLERFYANRTLHEKSLSAILILNTEGRDTFSNTTISKRVFNLMKERFVAVSGTPYASARDHGMVFVEGRIFLYVQNKLDRASQKAIGSVVIFREVTSEMLEKQSREIGLEFDIQYTSANHRVMKVSYANGIVVNALSSSDTDESIRIEYQVRYSGNLLQPASFVIHVPLDKAMLNQWVLPLTILLFIFGAVVSMWMVIRQFLIQPSLEFARLVTRGYDPSQTKQVEKRLPLELDRVYSEFRHLYQDIERQSRFSDLLLEAIGDVIITVNIDGEIEYTNPAAAHWLGFSETNLEGKPLELYLRSRDNLSSGVSNWLYQANIDKKRVETEAKVTVIGNLEQCFGVHVICQPIDLKYSVNGSSTSVIVIRINETHQCDHRNQLC